MQIVDYFPQFRKFWDAAARKPFDRQSELWHEMYFSSCGDLLKPYLERWTVRDFHLERAMLRYAASIGRMQTLSRQLAATSGDIVAKAAGFCGAADDVDVVVLVGLYAAPVMTMRRNRRVTILLFIEGFESVQRVEALLVRSLVGSFFLTGRCHRRGNGPFEGYSIGSNLAASGISLLGARQLVPGFPLHEYVTLTSNPQGHEWWQWCRRHERDLAARLLAQLPSEEPSVYDQYFGSAAAIGRSMTGWYLAWRLVTEVNREKANSALDVAASREWLGKCASILGEMAAPTERTPAAPAWVMPIK